MLQLLDFLYRQRIFLLFLLLEGISIWLIFSYNHRYNTYFFNSSNRISGEISQAIGSVETFFDLQRANRALAEENLQLRRALMAQNKQPKFSLTLPDSASYELYLAEVVNATYRKSKNYLTLKINPLDSIEPGMGVISNEGVVGTVKSVSKHFATVNSLLHPNLLVSGRVKSNDALSTVQWDGQNPLEADLKYVPRHLKLNTGDTVVTSGFNSVYPEGFVIGIVTSSELRVENPFYSARVKLANDFTNIRRVYIIRVYEKKEKELLEEEVINE